MNQDFQKKTRPNFLEKSLGGFTLIELLVVIAVIGLLSSIVLVALGGARTKARDARGQGDLRQISTAFELKYADVIPEAYPSVGSVAAPGIVIPAAGTLLDPYLKPVPVNNGRRTYYWYNPTDTQQYCVYFLMENPASPATYFYVGQKGAGINTVAGCP